MLLSWCNHNKHDIMIINVFVKQASESCEYFIFTHFLHIKLIYSSIILVKYCNRWQNRSIFEYSVGNISFDKFVPVLQKRRISQWFFLLWTKQEHNIFFFYFVLMHQSINYHKILLYNYKSYFFINCKPHMSFVSEILFLCIKKLHWKVKH